MYRWLIATVSVEMCHLPSIHNTGVEDVKSLHSPLHLFPFVVEVCLETYFEEEKQKEMH